MSSKKLKDTIAYTKKVFEKNELLCKLDDMKESIIALKNSKY